MYELKTYGKSNLRAFKQWINKVRSKEYTLLKVSVSLANKDLHEEEN